MAPNMVQTIIELDDGKIYRKPRKPLYLMVKPWFPVDFPLNQSIGTRLLPKIGWFRSSDMS